MTDRGQRLREAALKRARRSRSDVNLWRVPLQLTLAGVALFCCTIIPDVLDAKGILRLPTWFTMGGIDDARAILSAMMGCVSTVLALIFSVSLLVLSMIATLFGPRLLYRFLHDWVTQVTLGLFLATFVFLSLVFLVTHQDAHSTFIPQTSLIAGWILVVVSFGFLAYYSHRIALSIQNPDLIARIVDDLRPMLSQPTRGAKDDDEVAIEREVREGGDVLSVDTGYVQTIDRRALAAAAARAGR